MQAFCTTLRAAIYGYLRLLIWKVKKKNFGHALNIVNNSEVIPDKVRSLASKRRGFTENFHRLRQGLTQCLVLNS